MEAEVDRLSRLGARSVGEVHQNDSVHTVMQDPEGNGFLCPPEYGLASTAHCLPSTLYLSAVNHQPSTVLPSTVNRLPSTV